MRQTIQDLFDGKIAPCEQKHVQSEKYMVALKRMAELEEQLLVTLDDKGREVYDVYQDARADVMTLRDQANFENGFQMSVRLILEAVGE